MAFQYVDNALEGKEIYFHNTEGDRNSVVSQVSCRMDAAAVSREMSIFTHGEAGGIRRLPHRWQQTMEALED